MTRSTRMQPVAHVAQTRQHEAARQMGVCQRARDDQVRQLDELCTYRDEYAGRFETGSTGMLGLNVREYRLFLSRLNQAIEEQRHRVEQAEQALEQSRNAWLQSRVHNDAVLKVIDRMQAEERQEAAQRERVENDEVGQRPRRRQP